MGVDSSETSIEGVEVSVAGEVAKRDFRSEPRSLTAEERSAFLEYVEANPDCTVGEALEHVPGDVWRRDIKALRRTDPEFEEDYAQARGRGEEQIHAGMVKLALEGVKEPLVSAGKLVKDDDGNVVYVRKYSERLLQTMFNALTPEGRATVGGKFGIEINTGGGDLKLQEGVSLAEVAEFMREHVPGFQAQLEGEPAGELVEVTDEPVD